MPNNGTITDNSTVIASFGRFREVTTRKIWQYDYGMTLTFEGIDLPDSYTVHFSNQEHVGDATVQIGDTEGVIIPDELLQTGMDVYAWIFLHTGEDDGETVYKIRIPVRERPKPSEATPTTEERNLIDQAISLLNVATNEMRSATENAEECAQDSEAWAVGTRNGVDVDSNDETFHNNSAYYAAIAAQAAGNAGYMDFFINEDGDLIYSRTDAVNVDFEIRNGYLYMGVITDE